MSKLGKMPIEITEGVSASLTNREVHVQGPKGSLAYHLPDGINVKIEDGKIVVSQVVASKETRALFGLVRGLLANFVKGVSTGFEKQLELTGVGYRAQSSGTELTLSVGFSHPVTFKAPEGVLFTVEENVIKIAGINKELVGDLAAKIRAVRPPEPYKGKGISYKGERIRRKAGKAAKAVGAVK